MKRKHPIRGSWADENGNVIFIFYKDGRGYLDGHWGAYSISNGQIKITDGEGHIEFEGKYKVSEKKLTLKLGGYTEILTRKK